MERWSALYYAKRFKKRWSEFFVDRRPLLLVALVVLMLPSFEATAQQSAFDDEFNLGWEHNFGDVYITHGPLFFTTTPCLSAPPLHGGATTAPQCLLSTSKEIFSGPLENPKLNAP